MKGQLSAEMLIVLVIIIAIAALLAKTMMDSAQKTSTAASLQSTNTILTTTSCSDASDSACTKIDAGSTCDTTKGYCKAVGKLSPPSP